MPAGFALGVPGAASGPEGSVFGDGASATASWLLVPVVSSPPQATVRARTGTATKAARRSPAVMVGKLMGPTLAAGDDGPCMGT
ncbi:hypothetical protein SGRI78S_04496 [Streptomyces griseus subsp. griseus]